MVVRKLSKVIYSCYFIFFLDCDSLDFELTTGHQNKQNTNKIHHWFNYMAVKNRVHSSKGKHQFSFAFNAIIIFYIKVNCVKLVMKQIDFKNNCKKKKRKKQPYKRTFLPYNYK